MSSVYCDFLFPAEAQARLRHGLGNHSLHVDVQSQPSNLACALAGEALGEATIALGQPPVDAVLASKSLRWVHLTSAGFTRFDTPEVRAELIARGIALSSSSTVYAGPCAEHALAMMLAAARQLPQCLEDQRAERWRSDLHRERAFMLRGQTVVLLGYGAIGRALAALLGPFHMRVMALRRRPTDDAHAEVYSMDSLGMVLPHAQHLVNLLPDNPGTRGLVGAKVFERLPPGAFFYNLGRGVTVDQTALLDALKKATLGGAFLDVTNPEPLPGGHPLWTAPRCWISPHAAGGRREEFGALVDHFLGNLLRFERGDALLDRVV